MGERDFKEKTEYHTSIDQTQHRLKLKGNRIKTLRQTQQQTQHLNATVSERKVATFKGCRIVRQPLRVFQKKATLCKKLLGSPQGGGYVEGVTRDRFRSFIAKK